MRSPQAPIASLVAICLLLSSSLQPAVAGGLISTERAALTATDSPRVLAHPHPAATEREQLIEALVRAGVDRTQAQARLAALTDAEVLHLVARFNDAPAGGVWFAPFLLVAMVIGALIGTRDAKPGTPTTTDLFGRPRELASATD